MTHVKLDCLSRACIVSILSDNLLLVKKYLFPFSSDDKAIMLVRVEPLDMTLPFGQWSILPETGWTQHWLHYLCTPPRPLFKVGGGQYKTPSAAPTYNRLNLFGHLMYSPQQTLPTYSYVECAVAPPYLPAMPSLLLPLALPLPACSFETSMPPLFTLGYEETSPSHVAQDAFLGYLLAKTPEQACL
jgi:hypothetical protein